MDNNMGPKTTPSFISKGGIISDTPPPLVWDEIDTPWEIGLSGQRIKKRIKGSVQGERSLIY